VKMLHGLCMSLYNPFDDNLVSLTAIPRPVEVPRLIEEPGIH
jgi:hypothetical protein